MTNLIEFRRRRQIKKRTQELAEQMDKQNTALSHLQTLFTTHEHEDYARKQESQQKYALKTELPKPYVHPKTGVCPQKPQQHKHQTKDIIGMKTPEPYTIEDLKRDHPTLKEPYLHEPKRHSHPTSEITGKIQPSQIETQGLDADTVDQKHAKDLIAEIARKVKKVYVGGGADFLNVNSDILPATDGLFLGETATPRRWDGSRLINLDASKITSGQLADDRFLNAFLKTGERAMTGDLTIGTYKIKGTNVLMRQGSGVLANTMVFRNITDTAYVDVAMQNLKMLGNLQLQDNAYLYTREFALTKFHFKAWDDNLLDFVTVASIFADSGYMSDENVAIPRAGDITLLDDKFLQIGKDSDGTLPTPSASYRGKMIRVEGGAGVKDLVYICKKKADDTYAFLKLLDELDGGGGGLDEKVKVSATDTTTDYLQPKLVAGTGVTITKQNPSGNENLKIDAHDRLHALDSALDHSGAITDAQHGSRGSGLHADSHARQHALDSALDHTGSITDSQHGTRGSGLHTDSHPQLHQASHQSGGGDALSGNLDAVAKTTIRKNTGADIGSRRRVNFIEGSNVTLTIADDPTNEEVDVTIAAAGGGGGVAWRPSARWHKDITKTNIGTSFVNVYVGANGEQQLVDFTGFTQYRVRYHVNKVGSGTQTWRLLEANGTDVLGSIDDTAAAGEHELDSGWLSLQAWATGEKNLRPQGKSTVAGDDPVFRGATLWLK